MPRNSWLNTLALLLAVSACQRRSSAAHRMPPGFATATAPALGIRFGYPDSMILGRYRADAAVAALPPPELHVPFRDAAVLVSPADLAPHSPDSIPVGEVPAIWIDRPISTAAVLRLLQPDSTYVVGPLTVSRFPGFPGPYGDQAHYYLVRWPDSTVLELAGHRYRWRVSPTTPTGYGHVIEQIIPTLERLGPD
jgi:hypothetical protein